MWNLKLSVRSVVDSGVSEKSQQIHKSFIQKSESSSNVYTQILDQIAVHITLHIILLQIHPLIIGVIFLSDVRVLCHDIMTPEWKLYDVY